MATRTRQTRQTAKTANATQNSQKTTNEQSRDSSSFRDEWTREQVEESVSVPSRNGAAETHYTATFERWSDNDGPAPMALLYLTWDEFHRQEKATIAIPNNPRAIRLVLELLSRVAAARSPVVV